MNSAHACSVHALADHTVLPVCSCVCVRLSASVHHIVGLSLGGRGGERAGSSHSPEPTEDDSR